MSIKKTEKIMDFLGSRVKLSDMILEEMVAFSNDKETRRAAVRKILKDRGLGQVVQMLDSSKVKTVVL